MVEYDATVRARARMWLRGERAFGVLSIAIVEPDRTTVEKPDEATAASESAEVRAKPDPANLFGIPEKPTSLIRKPELTASGRAEPFTAPTLTTDQKHAILNAMDADEVRQCTQCRLCEHRTNAVFGEGDPDAKIMFIGEGPGQTEDETGRPFVGRAGEKLNDMIRGMGLSRQQVFIANIVKCRPPGNREPAPDEVATCTPFLVRQIEIIRPRVLVTLGRPALQFMIGQKISISRMRGQWLMWRGIKLMPTFHPAYILRHYTRETREAVWSDLKKVMEEIGMKVPTRGGNSKP